MRSLLILLILASQAVAADPPAPVVFPDSAAPVAPVIPPKPVPPKPKPPAIPVLTPDTLYVVDYPGDAIVLASPPGVVRITTEAGPVKIKAKFADGAGKVETRSFTGKSVITVEALTSGRAELIVIPVGATKESDIGRKLIDSLTAPLPPPVPPKPPAPKPSAAPIAGDGFKVLIVIEEMQAQTYPPAQQNAIYGKATRDYLNAKCPVGADGKTKEWRIYDQNVDASAESKVWQDAMKRERKSVPWIVVSNPQNGGGFEGPLPTTEAEITALLRKFGGN
jgi:hypothetical protein